MSMSYTPLLLHQECSALGVKMEFKVTHLAVNLLHLAGVSKNYANTAAMF